jgi:hypothetical protein
VERSGEFDSALNQVSISFAVDANMAEFVIGDPFGPMVNGLETEYEISGSKSIDLTLFFLIV